MKKFIILIIICLPTVGFAQLYDHAIGIRAGQTPGIEYRFYTDDANSYKFLLGTRNDGIQFHAFKEFHKYDLFTFTDQLILFYGVGIHAGYEQWDEYHANNNVQWYEQKSAFLTGMDGLAGLEYMFYEVPISLGIELKPYFDVLGRDNFRFQPWDFAFTVKYLF